jgi:hypothetical protein
MARQTTVIVTCDRCKKTYDPPLEDAVSFTGTPRVALLVERDALDDSHPRDAVLQFTDLCPKCDSRIDNLIAAMALEKDEKDEAAA